MTAKEMAEKARRVRTLPINAPINLYEHTLIGHVEYLDYYFWSEQQFRQFCDQLCREQKEEIITKVRGTFSNYWIEEIRNAPMPEL